jgi:hypothetical protein
MSSIRDYIKIVTEKSMLAEADAPAWTPDAEQAKWLGGANQQDPYILSRMPGAKPPVTHFTNPQDQALAKQLGFPAAPAAPAAAPAATPAAAPADDRNEMDKASDAAATQRANGVDPATGQMVSMKDPVTGQMINPENGLPVTPQAAPTQQAATPAKPARKPDPSVLDLQKKLIAAGAKITADGVMGPMTQAAMKQFPQAAGGQGATPSGAGAGRGSQGGPTAAELKAAATPKVPNVGAAPGTGLKGPTVAAAQGKDPSNPLNQPAGQAATPAAPAAAPAAPANPNAAKIQAEIDRFSKGNNMTLQANKDYVARLQAKLGSTAPAAPAAPVQQGVANADRRDMEESTGYDELQRIVSLIHHR